MRKYDDIVNLLQDIYKNIEDKQSKLRSNNKCNIIDKDNEYVNINYLKNYIKSTSKKNAKKKQIIKQFGNECKRLRSEYDDCINDNVKIHDLLYIYDYKKETYDEIFTLYIKYIKNDTNITIDDIKNIPTIIKNYLCIMNEKFSVNKLKINNDITLETINDKIVYNICFDIKYDHNIDLYNKFVDLFRNTIKSLSILNQFFMKEKKNIYKLDDKDDYTYINALNYTIDFNNFNINEIENTIESYVNSYTKVYIKYLDAINGYKEYIIDKYKNINNKDKIISNMNIFFKNFNSSVTLLTKKCCIIENISAENCSFYYLNDKMNEYD